MNRQLDNVQLRHGGNAFTRVNAQSTPERAACTRTDRQGPSAFGRLTGKIAGCKLVPTRASRERSPHPGSLAERVLIHVDTGLAAKDPLNRHLEEECGIQMIAPDHENRGKTRDGGALRRWVVERLFASLHWFRRLVARYDYHAENFRGMVWPGCMKIMLGHL